MLCSKSYSYEDLFLFLESGNIREKHFASLEIDEIKSKRDAEIFISNLINCDGKIREAAAYKYTEFMHNPKYQVYFSKYPAVLAQSTIDINANVSRMIIKGLYYLKDNGDFGIEYSKRLLVYIDEAFDGINKITYKDKKYTVNKQIFKLYWCLEGLKYFYKYVPQNILYNILSHVMELSEYTVREKAAFLIMQNKVSFRLLVERIIADKNYYVRKMYETYRETGI